MIDLRSDRPRFAAPSVRSLRQHVIEELRAAIVQGRIHPGDRLVEAELAADFEVSRGCVREALRGLEKEGFVVSTPYRETRVATTTEEETVEVLLPVRVIIEVFVVRRLAGRLTPEQVVALERVVANMHAAAAEDDRLRLTDLDIEFHRQLLSFVGEPAIQAVWSGIDARARGRFLIDTMGTSDPHAVARLHEEYLRTLRAVPSKDIGKKVVWHIYGDLPRRLRQSGPPLAAQALVDILATEATLREPTEPSYARNT
ncbi:MAG: GntR family transcriptional regulator [Chloroflexota bacterium]